MSVTCYKLLRNLLCFDRWYTLRGKPGKEKGKDKQRGELEVKVGFIVKAGSLTDLSKKEKHKSSLGQLSHMAQSVGKHCDMYAFAQIMIRQTHSHFVFVQSQEGVC